MRTVTTNFEKISLIAFKKVKGKQVKKEFWQTISPFNRKGDGKLKTKDEIWNELKAESLKWQNEI